MTAAVRSAKGRLQTGPSPSSPPRAVLARQTRLERQSQDRQRAATGVARTTKTKDQTMTQTNQPNLYAFAVEDAPRGQKSYWTRIGRLFPHKDGKGYDVVLNALPINGRIVIRQEEPKEEAAPQQ